MLTLVCCLDTASAQTLTVSPVKLTFNGSTPGTQSFSVTSSAATTVNLSTFPTWIQLNQTTGTTPMTFFVTIGAGAPAGGGNGNVSITAANGAQASVDIIYMPGGTTGTLTANPGSLAFSFAPGSTVPSSLPVTITSSNSAVTTFTTRTTTNDGFPWLSAAITSNLPNGGISVTVSPSQFPTGPGPFSGTVTLTSSDNQVTTIPVTASITANPAVTVSPTSLAFAFQVGTANPAAQVITLSTSTGATASLTATPKYSSSTPTCPSTWLVVSSQSISAPGTLSVSVNPNSVPSTTCQGEVDITGAGISNSPVVIPVSFLVTPNPLLTVNTSGLTFNYQPNSNTLTPLSQPVQIGTSNNAAVNFTVAATGTPNFVQLSTAGGTTPQTISVMVNPSVLATLAPGTYVDNVTISTAGAAANSPSFPVTLVVSNAASLVSNPPSLTFNYQIGQTAPANQTLTLSSSGAPLNYTVAATATTCPGFLSASTTSGTTGFTFGNQNQVTVAVNTAGLTTTQTCTGTLTFTSPGLTSPLTVPVTLNVSTNPLLNVGVPSINVTALAGSAQTTQVISLTSSNPTVPLTFSATAGTNPIGLTWLSVSPNSGNTPSNLVVNITPGTLAVGPYTGSITITGAFATQTIPVSLIIAATNITVTPASLTFNQAVGGVAPAFQTLQVTGVPAGTTIGATVTLLNGTGWLTTNVANNTVTVTANGSALSQGTYTGIVTVIVPGATNSPFNIPVTLVVGAPQSLILAANTVNFSYQAGAPTPATQMVQLSSSGLSVPFTATFVPGATNVTGLVVVAPTSGNTPSPLVLSLNQAVLSTLGPGTYSGKVVVSSTSIPGGDQTINVNVTVSAAAAPTITSIVNGASFAPGQVSPGELISIFGVNMGPTPGVGFVPVAGKIDVILAGTQVFFDNVPAPMIFVSGTQINAIVPYDVASLLNTGVGTKVTVVRGGVSSTPVVVGVTSTNPAIFSATQTGMGQGAILNQNLSANSVNNPAAKGSFISIYATGEGSLTPFVPSGTIAGLTLPLPRPIADVSVTIGGQAVQVTYAGEAPGLVAGVMQVNAMLPANIGSGPQQVVLKVGTNTNNTQVITVFVQ
jgi:trimeric autotransporter adhesin